MIISYSVRRIKGGKQVPNRPPKSPTNAQFAGFFARKIDEYITARARRLEKLWYQNRLPKTLATEIENLYQDVTRVSDGLKNPDGRLLEQSMATVEALSRITDSFYQRHLQTGSTNKAVTPVLTDLCEDIQHFVLQIRLTYNSFACGSKIPNRPTNHQLKESVFEKIVSYQKIHGVRKFPPYKRIAREVANEGFDLRDRTYRDYKTQYRKNTHNDLIQQRR
jgi:hypothetical protein